MARKLPKPALLKRRKSTVKPLKKIVIICEGKCTEPHYFNEFAKSHKNPLVTLVVIDSGGGIRELLDKVRSKQDELNAIAKKSSDTLDKEFAVWGVADVDDHPKLQEAINLKTSLNLKLVISNPCFEIWGIFHFEAYGAHIHRHAAQSKLKKLMKNYCHKKNPYFDSNIITEHFNTAVVNAKAALARSIRDGIPHDNPSSDVYLLLEEIAPNN